MGMKGTLVERALGKIMFQAEDDKAYLGTRTIDLIVELLGEMYDKGNAVGQAESRTRAEFDRIYPDH